MTEVESVRALLLHHLDAPAAGVGVVTARLLDPVDAPPPTSDDVLTVALAAIEAAEAPIGGIEFTTDAVDFQRDMDHPFGTIVSTRDGVITHRRMIVFGERGAVGIGEARYGHLPGGGPVRDPLAVLLPDAEVGLAELVVYARRRAEQIGYTGRVRVLLSHVHDGLPLPVPFIVSEETGGLVASDADPRDLWIEYDYDLSDPPQEQERAHRDAAARLAQRWGADGPQWYQ